MAQIIIHHNNVIKTGMKLYENCPLFYKVGVICLALLEWHLLLFLQSNCFHFNRPCFSYFLKVLSKMLDIIVR